MQAGAEAECVRCLTPFDQRLAINFDDLFVYPPERASETLLAIPETGLLDLGPLTREYMLSPFLSSRCAARTARDFARSVGRTGTKASASTRQSRLTPAWRDCGR